MRDALSKHDDIGNSLIVLPEAFNNGEVYNDEYCRRPLIRSDDTLKDLAAIAEERDLVFIVGLLEPPNNSAYLIGDGRPRLMCHKQVHCDIRNPIEIDGACIGALICSDARDDCQRVTDKVEQSSCVRKVVCIPASMSSGTLDSDRLEIPAYRNKYVILANAKTPPFGSGSFLANKAGRKFEGGNFKWTHNAISVTAWSQLDDLGA